MRTPFKHECQKACPFGLFFRSALLPGFILDQEGTVLDANRRAMEVLRLEASASLANQIVFFDSQEKKEKFLSETVLGIPTRHQIEIRLWDSATFNCSVWAQPLLISGKKKQYIITINNAEDFLAEESQRLIDEKKKIQEERINFLNDSMLLANYLSDDLIKYVNETGENPLVNKKMQATILFFDIRHSTKIAEKLESDVFANFLSEIFTDIMDLIYGNHGFVNKMLGDGIMATFGCPISIDNDAANAVQTAQTIVKYLDSFNLVRPDFLVAPVSIGIGVATGTVFTGVIGSVRRQEYTVLGDAVNIASRLESLTKQLNTAIVIDENTYNLLQDKSHWTIHNNVEIRGRESKISVYSRLPD